MKNWYWPMFGLIIVTAACLRLYQLGEVPVGMTWDEAAIGYNGFALRETGRDEWLKLLPISFQSFGDYKAPLAIYLNGLFTLIFGMNLWAVRLPFALSGILAVVGVGLLTKELWSKRKRKSYFSAQHASLLGMLLLTLSPWHIHFSRIGFESGLALTELIWATYFFVVFVYASGKNKLVTYGSLALAIVGFAASFYTYHSAKIVAPLLLFLIFWCFREQLFTFKQKLWSLVGGGVAGLALLVPLLYDTVYASGAERLSQTSLFGLNLSLSELLTQVATHYVMHFNPSFLLLGQTDTLRHGSGAWSVFLPTTLVLIIIGFFWHWRSKVTSTRLFWLAVVWILIGIIPAAIGRDTPHSNRALLALPGFLMLAVQGAEAILAWLQQTPLNQRVRGNHGETNIIVKSVVGYSLLLHFVFSFLHLRHYYTAYAQTSTDAFQAGYLEMLEYVVPLEKKHTPEIEKIIMSSEYGQPYIYTLFARRTNPYWYHGGSLIKYEFTEVTMGDLQRKNAIVVASQKDKEELPFEKADTLIYGPDGSVRFAVFITEVE